MKKVIIIGASGQGRVVADIIRASGDEVVGFLDDNKKLDTLGIVDDSVKYPNTEYIIAIGASTVREKFSNMKLSWYTAIHPSAIISPDAEIGEGSVVMPNAVINSGVRIGKHSIINTGAVVEHDNVLGDYVHISVGAKTGGTVTIGKSTWVGIGATVTNNIKICDNVIIGAGIPT